MPDYSQDVGAREALQRVHDDLQAEQDKYRTNAAMLVAQADALNDTQIRIRAEIRRYPEASS